MPTTTLLSRRGGTIDNLHGRFYVLHTPRVCVCVGVWVCRCSSFVICGRTRVTLVVVFFFFFFLFFRSSQPVALMEAELVLRPHFIGFFFFLPGFFFCATPTAPFPFHWCTKSLPGFALLMQFWKMTFTWNVLEHFRSNHFSIIGSMESTVCVFFWFCRKKTTTNGFLFTAGFFFFFFFFFF